MSDEISDRDRGAQGIGLGAQEQRKRLGFRDRDEQTGLAVGQDAAVAP